MPAGWETTVCQTNTFGHSLQDHCKPTYGINADWMANCDQHMHPPTSPQDSQVLLMEILFFIATVIKCRWHMQHMILQISREIDR